MTGPGCLRAGALLTRRSSGVTEAERLLLEAHLAGCERCRQDGALLTAIAEMTELSRPPLSPQARDRAIARALDAASAARAPAPAVASPLASSGGARFARLSLALAAVAAVGVLVFGERWRNPAENPGFAELGAPSASVAAAPAEPGESRLLGGEAELGGVALRPGDPLGEGPAELRATGAGASLALGHARVELAAGGELAWDPTSRTATLRSGAVTAEVDKGPQKRFRVATPRFVVEVVGTRFRVDLDGVRVSEGIVRISAPDGRPLVGALRAGEEWLAPPAEDAGEPDAAAEPAQAPEAQEPSGAQRPSIAPAERLARARQRLAKGDAAGARRELEAVLAGRPGPREEAEARTLLAECALVEGDGAGAARRYEEVARRYPDQAAGENALFAAARLEANAGRKDKARELLREYLRRFPQGRFRKEAAARLEALGG